MLWPAGDEGAHTKKGRRAEILIELQPLQLTLTAVNQGCSSAAAVPAVGNRRGAGGGEKESDESAFFSFIYRRFAERDCGFTSCLVRGGGGVGSGRGGREAALPH